MRAEKQARVRQEWAEAQKAAAERDAMHQAISQLRQVRRVRSRLAQRQKAARDGEAGLSGGV